MVRKKNLISKRLLPANEEKTVAVFSSGTINLKRKNVKAGKYEELDKAVFKWSMSARLSKIPVTGLVIKLFSSGLCLQDQVKYQWLD